METSLSFAIRLARQTGDLLLQYYQSKNLATNLKADRSVVTEADVAADHLIATSIHCHYPEDFLVSEELQPDYPFNRAEPYQQYPDSRQYSAARQDPAAEIEPNRGVWIIDPLDGTTNFNLGLPIWGVILARLTGGWPETAVLYFPMLGELYSAHSKQGAFLNEARLQVQPPNSRRPLSFFSCCSRTHRYYQVSIPYKTRILGSAGYSMCAVAQSIAIVAFEAAPKIWDIAAAWLLVNEAGGVIETLDHSQPFPLQPGVDYSHKNYPTLAAANPEVLAHARQQIFPKE